MKKPVAIGTTLAVGIGIGVALRPSAQTAEAITEPTWTVLQLTGYDAEGEPVTMAFDWHPMTRFDLWPELQPGDVTGDGKVDLDDLGAVLSNFGAGY